MKRSFCTCLLLAASAWLLPTAAPAAQPQLKLERVVMLMRHGIRPPTALQPIPLQYSAKPWPQWPVAPGLLTPHGAQGITLLATSDRGYFAKSGLLAPSGCPATGQVSITASHVPRAVATAEAWSNGFATGCNVAVAHPAPGAPDPLFHILDPQPAWFDGRRAYQAALAQPPKGGIAVEVKQLAPELTEVSSILGCVPPACNLMAGSSIKEHPHGRPDVEGPLDAASTAGETFLLEYLEGMPKDQVAWGLANRNQISRLLVFNSVKFKYADRPRFIAAASAGPLAKAIVQALTSGPPVTLLAGHDTNIADLGGLLNAHWRVAGYPADAIPPGSAFGFELLSDRRGRQFVRPFFRAQTMKQLRNLEPLSAANPPYRQLVHIPGCSSAAVPSGCELGTFTRLVAQRMR